MVKLKWRSWLIMEMSKIEDFTGRRSQVAGRRCASQGRRSQGIGIGKRGLLSNFLAFFGATIAVVLILTFFVLGAGLVKKLDNKGSDVAIYDESDVEVDNIFDYSKRYVLLSEARFLIAGEEDVDVALREFNVALKKSKEVVPDLEGKVHDVNEDERVAA